MRCRRSLSASVLPLLVLGLMLPGCGREGGISGDSQVQSLQTKEELERTKRKLAMVEHQMSAKDDAVALAKEESDNAAKQVAEKERVVADKDAQIAALQKQIVDLKKGETQVYADASKLHQQAMNTTSLLHYREFIAAFPTSPLVADANRAIAELTAVAQKDVAARTLAADPRAVAEREFQRQFSNGFASIEDIGAAVKHKSMAEVVKLLGPPNRTFRDNSELGYVDKVMDPSTGNRGTLVIAFSDDQVSTLRIGYQGRPMRP